MKKNDETVTKRPSDPSSTARLCSICRRMRDFSGETFGWALCYCGSFRHPLYIARDPYAR